MSLNWERHFNAWMLFRSPNQNRQCTERTNILDTITMKTRIVHRSETSADDCVYIHYNNSWTCSMDQIAAKI